MSCVLRLPVAALILVTASGCPPARMRTSIEVTVHHDARPVAHAHLIDLTHTRMTDEYGAVELIIDRGQAFPDGIIHPTLGAHSIHGVHIEDVGEDINGAHHTAYFKVGFELDGFEGREAVECGDHTCRVTLPIAPDESCHGRFVFAPDDPGPLLPRPASQTGSSGTRYTAEVVMPAMPGALAYIGTCYTSGRTRPIFASAPYEGPPADATAVGDIEHPGARRQRVMSEGTPYTELIESAFDSDDEVRSAAHDALVSRLDTARSSAGWGAMLTARESSAVARAEAGLKEAIRRFLAGDASTLPPVREWQASFAALPWHAPVGPPDEAVFSCGVNRCRIASGCVGRLAFRCVDFETMLYTSFDVGARARRETIISSERDAVTPCVGLAASEVVFGGTCDGAPRFEMVRTWTMLSDPWRDAWLDTLDDPAHRAHAARALAVHVEYVPAEMHPGRLDKRPVEDAAAEALEVARRLVRVTASGDVESRMALVMALDDLARVVLGHRIATGAVERVDAFARITAAAVPAALKALDSADIERAPLHLLAVHAPGIEPAATAFVSAFDRQDGRPDEAVAALYAAAFVPLDLRPRLGSLLTRCEQRRTCRIHVFQLMAQYPEPGYIEPVVATSPSGLYDARVFLAGRPVQSDVATRLLESAFEDDSSELIAARALRMMRPAVDDVLAPALEAVRHAPTRDAGLIVLGGLPGHPRAIETLYATLRDGTPSAQLHAVASLAEMQVVPTVTILIEAASLHPEPATRHRAIEVLVRVTVHEAAARAALVRISETDLSRQARRKAAAALRQFDRRRRPSP